ncbi:50S ribosomal protein L3 rplC [Mycobacteroides abscessus]|nr:50S ribosomal protein L3 rplC [Mycobacteroides abscessus]
MARKGILGTKLGMTQVFDDNNRVVPVTVVKAGPNVVTRIRTTEQDGYSAVQLAYGEISPRKVTKPVTGQFAAAGINPGLAQVLDVHRLGNPAVRGRGSGLHQHAHGDLGQVARGDRVEGLDVVVDEVPLGGGHLAIARLHPVHMRHHRGEVGDTGHHGGGEQGGTAGLVLQALPDLVSRRCAHGAYLTRK